MRSLSDIFLTNLKDGFLSEIKQKVVQDKDLDLQIRENYLNIYYKGNSLLKLTELSDSKYRVTIEKKFKHGLDVPPYITDQRTATSFMAQLPFLKENIITYGITSLEVEYEQMVIRANNYEERNNTEYYIVDRQYSTNDKQSRFDLTGFFWNRANRRKGQQVPLCFIEVKFSLNPDIRNVHSQLERYYASIRQHTSDISEEAERIFKQKLELDLIDGSRNRINALKTLSFSRDINDFQFIVLLIDYNPNSTLFNIENLRQLTFADQIRIFEGGFAMWQQRLRAL